MNEAKEIRLAIVGSRTFNDYNVLKQVITKLLEENNYKIKNIVSGGARGADTFAEQYAKENGIVSIVYKADWDTYGKKAGFLRNVDIINNCDVCLAFWDGESRGTKHDLELCEKYNKECWVYNFKTMGYAKVWPIKKEENNG
jgi:hypothetical protein